MVIGLICSGPRKGQPKRNVGTFYPDTGETHTQEMFEEDNGYERPKEDTAG